MSRIFVPFKAVGLVCDECPPVLHQMGKASFVAAAVGRSVHMYRTDHLAMRLATPSVAEPIT